MRTRYRLSKMIRYGAGIIVISLFSLFMMSGCDNRQILTEPDTSDQSSQDQSLQDQSLEEEEDESDQEEDESDKEDESGYCQGDEILCIERFTPEAVQKNGGILHGGNFHNGAFTPSNRGGIEFNFDLDTNREYEIEIELDGNIANSHVEDELGGGKVTLFEMHARNSDYFYTSQRMAHGYRGTGIFRTNPGHLITTADLSGYYSMSNWGNETHLFEFEANGDRHRMIIDQYVSRWERGLDPGGTLHMQFMFGNRMHRYDNQHCITNFRRLKISYR